MLLCVRIDRALVDERDGWAVVESDHTHKTNRLRDVYQITRLIWPSLAVASLGLAASKSAKTSPDRLHVLGLS
jgi:voltage-dependent calcium channel